MITSPCIHTTAEKLSSFQAFTITEPAVGRGIGPATALIDPLYASARDAWLLATVKYNVLAPGVSNLYLQIGRHGILNQGSNPNSPADLDVVFGSDFASPLSSNNNRECDVDCNSAGPQTTDAVISVTSLPPSSGVTTTATATLMRQTTPTGATSLVTMSHLGPAPMVWRMA